VELVFAGICCWVDAKAPKTGKTVIIPNSTRGGTHRGGVIPPHMAFVHAKKNQVQSVDWEPAITAGDNLVYLLEGDRITFDPAPGGGAIDVSALPHVKTHSTKTPICPAADELRTGFRDEPNAFNVLGIVDLSADAPVTTSENGLGAVFARLRMPDGPVTITASPFSGEVSRSLKIVDPSASVFIANVTLMDYLLGTPAPEDDHKYLVCEMFKPHATAAASARTPSGSERAMNVELSEVLTSPAPKNPLGDTPLDRLNAASGKNMEDFLCTFAAGCSDSRWP
jgi:hypothetical protein